MGYYLKFVVAEGVYQLSVVFAGYVWCYFKLEDAEGVVSFITC